MHGNIPPRMAHHGGREGQSMKAMVYRSRGGPEKLRLAEVPRPVAGPGQVLLRTLATAVNPVDWKLAKVVPRFGPGIPGREVSGDAVEVGPGAGFAVGLRLHALLGRAGCAAEFVAVDAAVAVPFPPELDPGQAAALPLAGLTALQALRDKARLPLEGASGVRVLVVGASGGVGHLGVQIARAAGCTVTGVCSAGNADLVRDLGAADVIDYRQAGMWEGRGPWDVILDAVGQDWAALASRLTPHGRLVSALPGPGLILRSLANGLTPRKVDWVMCKPDAAGLRHLDALAAAGQLRVVVERRFRLEELPLAWERSMTGRTVGKLVIEVG